jgi:hypothetical protein
MNVIRWWMVGGCGYCRLRFDREPTSKSLTRFGSGVRVSHRAGAHSRSPAPTARNPLSDRGAPTRVIDEQCSTRQGPPGEPLSECDARSLPANAVVLPVLLVEEPVPKVLHPTLQSFPVIVRDLSHALSPVIGRETLCGSPPRVGAAAHYCPRHADAQTGCLGCLGD